MEMYANLLLVRHSETDWNTQHRYSGQSNKPKLTPRGIAQSNKVARALEALHKPPVAIYCSDLRRAWRTARIIGRRLWIKPVVDKRLREVGLGAVDGLLKTELAAQYDQPKFSTRHPDFDFRPLGGECRGEVIARQLEFMDECVRRHGIAYGHPNKPSIVVVGHGTAFRILCERLEVDSKLEQGDYKCILKTAPRPLP